MKGRELCVSLGRTMDLQYKMVSESSGTVPFKVGSKTYHTWYKVFGDLNCSRYRPLVALHGGPGMSHHYMLSVCLFSGRENSTDLPYFTDQANVYMSKRGELHVFIKCSILH